MPLRDLVQTGELFQEPAVQIPVADPAAQPDRRPVSGPPWTEPATTAAVSSGARTTHPRLVTLSRRVTAMVTAPRPRARDGGAYLCAACDATSLRWAGRCPACGEWNTLGPAPVRRGSARPARPGPPALALVDVSTDGIHPLATGVSELDRVMGGGVVAGSVTLLFGPPGIGKSTLLFQVLSSLAATGLDVMLASAEESLAQVRGRASRMGLVPRNLLAIEGPDVEAIEAAVERHRPALVVVDSLQSVSDPELGQPAGSLAQVRTCVERLTRMAKSTGHPCSWSAT